MEHFSEDARPEISWYTEPAQDRVKLTFSNGSTITYPSDAGLEAMREWLADWEEIHGGEEK